MSKRKIKSIIVVFLLCLVLNIKNGTIFAAQTEKSCYDVLLGEDTLPWESDANSHVLKEEGFSAYSNYAKFMGNIETFASLGIVF